MCTDITGAELLGRRDAHNAAIQGALDGELNVTINRREQRVVFTDTDIGAGVELGTALTHDDRARCYQLTAERLNTQHLWV